jgi:hypothetical protein
VSGSSAFQVGFSGATLTGVLIVSGNTTFQGASTDLSTLNITGNIIGSGTA